MKKGPHFYICWLIRLDFAGSQTKGLLKKHHVQFPLSSTKKHSLIFSPKDYRVCWFPWVFHRFLKKKPTCIWKCRKCSEYPPNLGFFSTSKIPAMGIFQKKQKSRWWRVVQVSVSPPPPRFADLSPRWANVLALEGCQRLDICCCNRNCLMLPHVANEVGVCEVKVYVIKRIWRKDLVIGEPG